MTTVVGLDQSFTNSGLCVFNDAHMVHYELISSDKDTDKFDRALFISNKIKDLVKHWNADKVIYESLSFSSFGNVTRDLSGLLYLIVTELRTILPKESIVEIAPTSLKKFATGSGRAKKEDLYESLPEDVKTIFSQVKKTKGRYDLTDAYWLARHGVDNNV